MILYKYRGNSDNTDKIFADRKIWLSNAAGLNDPFECTIQEIAKDWIEKQVIEMKQAQLSGLVFAFMSSKKNKTDFFGLDKSQARKFMGSFKELNGLEEQYNHFREFRKSRFEHYPPNPIDTFIGFDQQLNEAGIFSLSETSDNQLMWALYGQEAKGIAIGFEVESNSKLSNPDYCVKVNYSDALPAFGSEGFLNLIAFYMDEFGMPYSKQKISFSDPTFKLAISTKPTVWSYEKEWRYVEETSGAFPFPARISEIVFGMRCSDENRKKYIYLVKAHIPGEVSFFEIQAIQNTNSIIKVKIPE